MPMSVFGEVVSLATLLVAVVQLVCELRRGDSGPDEQAGQAGDDDKKKPRD